MIRKIVKFKIALLLHWLGAHNQLQAEAIPLHKTIFGHAPYNNIQILPPSTSSKQDKSPYFFKLFKIALH